MNDIELMFDGYKIIAEYVEELTDAPSIDELICDTAWQVINDACHEHSAGCFNEDY